MIAKVSLPLHNFLKMVLSFYWNIIALQCCQFLLYKTMNQPFVYIYIPSFLGIPSTATAPSIPSV